MVRLADVLRPGVPVALLKINVERFERGVLAGLTPELLQGVRNVLVEMADAETRALIRRQLEGAGFFAGRCRSATQTATRATLSTPTCGGRTSTRC